MAFIFRLLSLIDGCNNTFQQHTPIFVRYGGNHFWVLFPFKIAHREPKGVKHS